MTIHKYTAFSTLKAQDFWSLPVLFQEIFLGECPVCVRKAHIRSKKQIG